MVRRFNAELQLNANVNVLNAFGQVNYLPLFIFSEKIQWAAL